MSYRETNLPSAFTDLALKVKRNDGAKKYLAGVADKLRDQILAVPEDRPLKDILVISGPQRQTYEVKRRVIAASKQRRLDHTRFKREHPELYLRVTTPKPADKKYSMYYSRAVADAASWNSLQAEGASAAESFWAKKTANTVWTNTAAVSEVLYRLRSDITAREQLDKEWRKKMSHMLESDGFNPGKVHVSGYGDIDVRDYNPGVVTNYALIENHPVAQAYVSTHTVKGYSTIAFVPIVDEDDQELTEDDYNAKFWD